VKDEHRVGGDITEEVSIKKQQGEGSRIQQCASAGEQEYGAEVISTHGAKPADNSNAGD
jgi:hypothetical protein